MYKYDFGLSFAGEQRDDAMYIAQKLKENNINVFYDDFFEGELWGKNLYTEFCHIYKDECRFFVPFISKDYAQKAWPKHELVQAQERALYSNVEYILPLRYDDTEVPGINSTTKFIEMKGSKNRDEVVQLCLKKLVKYSSVRALFFFLRNHNPDALMHLKEHKNKIVIRVGMGQIKDLNLILKSINTSVCEGVDDDQYLANGGSKHHISSTDPEPHTTFSIILHQAFYDEVII